MHFGCAAFRSTPFQTPDGKLDRLDVDRVDRDCPRAS
jgi:hypothetical protein